MKRVRTALVGCGKVGQIHAQALAALAESEFVAACDVELSRALAFGDTIRRAAVRRRQARCSSSAPSKLYASARPTRCTPSPHSGRPRPASTSLVEKPMAASLEDCDAMLAAAAAVPARSWA